jgi:hypothetical protein
MQVTRQQPAKGYPLLGWPEVTPDEMASGADAAFIENLRALNVASLRVRIAIDNCIMFKELGQRRAVVEAINAAGPVHGVRLVVQTILRDLVVAAAACFDQNGGATDINRIVNMIVRPQHRDMLAAFHRTWIAPPDTEAEIAKLAALKDRLNTPHVRGSIERLRHLRRNTIAHVDLNPEFPLGQPLVHEIPAVLMPAAATLVQANFVALGRVHLPREVIRISRRHAREFSDTLLVGIATQWAKGTSPPIG